MPFMVQYLEEAEYGIHLPTEWGRVLNQFPDESKADFTTLMASYTDANPVNFATVCSGTENCQHVVKSFQMGCEEVFDTTFALKHILSCDLDVHSRQYIAEKHKPDFLFRDLRDLSEKTAYCHKSEKMVNVPQNSDIVLAGTSCVDVSYRNPKRKMNQRNIHLRKGQTGRNTRKESCYANTQPAKLIA